MPTLTGVTNNYFPTAQEGFTTTLAATASYGAATISLNGSGTYANAANIVLVLEPGTANFNAVTGVLNTSTNPITVTGCIWTEGGSHSHNTGAAVADDFTATHLGMYQKGLLVQHTQAGLHHNLTNTGGMTNAGGLTTDTINTSSAATLASLVLNGSLTGTGLASQVQTYTNSASAGGGGSYINLGGIKLCWGTGNNITTNSGATAIAVNLPTSFFTNVLYCNLNIVSLATQTNQYANLTNFSTTILNGFLVSNGTGSAVPGWFVIGN